MRFRMSTSPRKSTSPDVPSRSSHPPTDLVFYPQSGSRKKNLCDVGSGDLEFRGKSSQHSASASRMGCASLFRDRLQWGYSPALEKAGQS